MLSGGAGCIGGGVDDGRWLCHVRENHCWTAYQVHSLLWVGCTLYVVGWWPLVLFDAGDWCQWESLPAAWPTTQQATLFAWYFEHGYFELTKMEAVKDNHLSDIMQKTWTLCLTQMRLVSKLFKPDPMDFTHKSDASSIWWVLKLFFVDAGIKLPEVQGHIQFADITFQYPTRLQVRNKYPLMLRVQNLSISLLLVAGNCWR